VKVSARLRSVLRSVRGDWRDAVQLVQPSNQFGAQLLMGVISLHLEAKEILKTNNLQKRKELMNEFAIRKKTVENAIRYLAAKEKQQTKPPENRAMSGLW